jgi:uncharacterized membrane protein
MQGNRGRLLAMYLHQRALACPALHHLSGHVAFTYADAFVCPSAKGSDGHADGVGFAGQIQSVRPLLRPFSQH